MRAYCRRANLTYRMGAGVRHWEKQISLESVSQALKPNQPVA